MPIAEGVDHQNVDRAGHAGKVGPRGGEHVPGIHIHETGKEVDAVSGNQSDEDDTSSRRAEEGLQEITNTLVEGEIKGTSSESVLDKVEGQNNDVGLDDTEVDERERVRQTRTMQCQYSCTKR